MLRLFEYVHEHKKRDESFLRRNLSYFEPVASDEHASDRFLKVHLTELVRQGEHEAYHGDDVTVLVGVASELSSRLDIHYLSRCTVPIRYQVTGPLSKRKAADRQNSHAILPATVLLPFNPSIKRPVMFLGIFQDTLRMHMVRGRAASEQGQRLHAVPHAFSPTPAQPFYAQLTYWALPAAAPAQRPRDIPRRTFETRLVTAHLIEATDRLHKVNGTRATTPELRQYVYPPDGAACNDPHAFSQLNTMRTQREVHASAGGSMPEVTLHTRSEQCVLALCAPLQLEAQQLESIAALLGRGTLSVLADVSVVTRVAAKPPASPPLLAIDYRHRGRRICHERTPGRPCPLCNLPCSSLAALIAHITVSHPDVAAYGRGPVPSDNDAALCIDLDIVPDEETRISPMEPFFLWVRPCGHWHAVSP